MQATEGNALTWVNADSAMAQGRYAISACHRVKAANRPRIVAL